MSNLITPDDAANGAASTPRDTTQRREREAAALRDNLARRKAQSRARQQAKDAPPEKDPSACQ